MSTPAASTTEYDVVIVGAGVSGAMIAKQLGLAGKKVLVLEAGAGIPTNINDFMERFYKAVAKVPEVPYTPDIFTPAGSSTLTDPATLNAGRPNTMTLSDSTWQDPKVAYMIQEGALPFSSTYERIAGGTMRHWLGTSLRNVPNDFRMFSAYQKFVDWPLSYDDLEPWYEKAEWEIGVSADKSTQNYLGITFPSNYQYPMQPIPPSLVDDAVTRAVSGKTFEGIPLVVTETPAGRNSQPYQNRRVCAGNTNCIPICPIQAKYDPSVTWNMALDTGNVTLMTQTVASEIIVDANNQVSQINYIQYADNLGPATAKGSVTAKRYVLAAHAVETPKLCLMSKNNGLTAKGVANSSGLMGQNLMDHPLYLAWAQAAEPVFGFRGPLATSGIESMRDGDFRKDRAAFRIEIGNEGWNFAIGDPWTTTLDFINGWNNSQLNPKPPASSPPQALWGADLVKALNDGFSRQFRLGFLVEQSPETSNYVTVSTTEFDHLGLPRPEIVYDLSDYTKAGFVAAKKTADAIFAMMGATQFTSEPDASDPAAFEVDIDGKTQRLKFFGAGHIVGTYRMGTTSTNSVVDADQRSWDHNNLFLVGSGNFPTVATANPTLTIAALALKAAQTLLDDLS
ncbi:MAG: GMC family oxidoreductase [Lysobacterales bacterium]